MRRESPETEERREIARHNVLYKERRPSRLALEPADWQKFDAIGTPLSAYHAAVLRLGDLRAARVLDLGCGDGWFSVILAKRGARVTACDLSVEAARTGRARGVANGVDTTTSFAVASAYEIPFREHAFDLVAGMAILHHLSDKPRVAAEISRVLRPGGRAVFMEPLGESLLLERLRRLVPVRSEAEDDPDQWATQFKRHELGFFQDNFVVDCEVFHILSRLDRVTSSETVKRVLGHVDRQLLKRVPALRRFGRSIVVELRKSSR